MNIFITIILSLFCLTVFGKNYSIPMSSILGTSKEFDDACNKIADDAQLKYENIEDSGEIKANVIYHVSNEETSGSPPTSTCYLDFSHIPNNVFIISKEFTYGNPIKNRAIAEQRCKTSLAREISSTQSLYTAMSVRKKFLSKKYHCYLRNIYVTKK